MSDDPRASSSPDDTDRPPPDRLAPGRRRRAQTGPDQPSDTGLPTLVLPTLVLPPRPPRSADDPVFFDIPPSPETSDPTVTSADAVTEEPTRPGVVTGAGSAAPSVPEGPADSAAPTGPSAPEAAVTAAPTGPTVRPDRSPLDDTAPDDDLADQTQRDDLTDEVDLMTGPTHANPAGTERADHDRATADRAAALPWSDSRNTGAVDTAVVPSEPTGAPVENAVAGTDSEENDDVSESPSSTTGRHQRNPRSAEHDEPGQEPGPPRDRSWDDTQPGISGLPLAPTPEADEVALPLLTHGAGRQEASPVGVAAPASSVPWPTTAAAPTTGPWPGRLPANSSEQGPETTEHGATSPSDPWPQPRAAGSPDSEYGQSGAQQAGSWPVEQSHGSWPTAPAAPATSWPSPQVQSPPSWPTEQVQSPPSGPNPQIDHQQSRPNQQLDHQQAWPAGQGAGQHPWSTQQNPNPQHPTQQAGNSHSGPAEQGPGPHSWPTQQDSSSDAWQADRAAPQPWPNNQPRPDPQAGSWPVGQVSAPPHPVRPTQSPAQDPTFAAPSNQTASPTTSLTAPPPTPVPGTSSRAGSPAPAVVPVPPVWPTAPAGPDPSDQGAAEPLRLGGPRLPDFLAQQAPPPNLPATWGVRGVLSRMGLRMAPTSAELAHRHALATIQRPLGGPKTIVVVNQKGGAGKTPATFLLAAVIGRVRGGFTLAWDNNENAGTLGWKGIGQERGATVVDLLGELERFTHPELGRIGDLDNFVRSQGDDRFDLLASNQSTDQENTQIGSADFHAIHEAMSRYYRVLMVDTGNNDLAPNWRAALDAADQIVVPIRLGLDYAGGASRTLDVLDDIGHGDLVRNAVVIVSQSTDADKPDVRKHVRDHFGPRVRSIVEVPFDPELVEGRIVHDALRTQTRLAWTRAAAAVVSGL